MMRRGFSLVELSIVLVILGLLVGGVLSGQSLIRASELRAVTEEYMRYSTAIGAFRDKYFAIPGDMANATAFWGKDNANCPGNTGTAATPGTCNGDGNGIVGPAAAISGTGEDFQFWKQLALAGIIEGNYTGLSGPASLADGVIGTNGPKSKLGNAGWSIYGTGIAGDAWAYQTDYGNEFIFGTTSVGNLTDNAVLKPEEAWNIDTKIDDGLPGTGKVIARFWNNACASATSNTDYTDGYKLSNTALACALNFVKN
jgi:prepilin-type N-terminal cleavage/methylation domain-containing protein